MKNILLVLSTTRQSPKTIDLAVERAKKEGARLIVLFILDSGMPDSIFEKLTDIGFTGEKPSQQLYDSILLEYRERGKRKLMEIEEAVSGTGVPVECLIREGDFASCCLDVIREKGADLVILTRKKRSTLSRFIFGSAIEDVEREAGCELVIVDE